MRTLLLVFFILSAGSLQYTCQCAEVKSAIVYDLSQRLGIQWSLVSPPSLNLQKQQYHMRSLHDGAAVFSSVNKTHLYLWHDGAWEKLFDTALDSNIPLFKTTDRLWFALSDTIPYRRILCYSDDAGIDTIYTPQANGIRSLFFIHPDLGWAGCEWGQLLQWDGSIWRLVRPFTPYHAEAIFSINDSMIFSRNDIPAKNCTEFFEYSQQNWRAINRLCSTSITGNVLLLNENLYFLPRHDSLYIRYKDSWQLIDLASIHRDTIILPTKVHPQQLIWASHKGVVRTSNYTFLENHLKCNENDIIAIVQCAALNKTSNESSFFLFSKKALKKILRVVSQDYQAEEQKIIFRTSINHVAGTENGVCIADFTGDGLEDVYAVVGGAANRLYPASADEYPGRVAEIAEEAGVLGGAFTDGRDVNYDYSPSNADIDNDGDQDLLVTSLYGPSVLFRQWKKGRFTDHTRKSLLDHDHGRSFLGIWSDVNRDGAIDLFVNNSDSMSHLYLNNGAGIFRDITQAAGLERVHSSSAAFADTDNDGDEDLVCIAGGHIVLYENESRENQVKFALNHDQHFYAGPDSLSPIAGMFLADLDNDGDVDLYTTRVMTRDLLFENRDGFFENVTESTGIVLPAYGVEAVPLDADNDGDLDIYISNRGSVTFYENRGCLKFYKKNVIDDAKSFGGAVAVADFENDGDLDIYTADRESNSRILINTTNNNNFIKLDISGSRSNRDAIGTRIDIYAADSSRQYLGMRRINGGQGALSGSSRIVHVGVDDSRGRTFKIHFPSGKVKYVYNMSRGQKIKVYESTGLLGSVDHFRAWLRRHLFYTPLQHDLLFLALCTLIFFFLKLCFRKFLAWTPQTAFLLFWLPFSILFMFFFLLHRDNAVYDYVIPVSFSAVSWSLGFFFTQKLEQRHQHHQEIEEELFFKSAAFFHGEWGASKLNRLQFFAANFDQENAQDSGIKQGFIESINEFYSYVLPELENILRLAGSIASLRETQAFAKKNYKDVIRDLNSIKVDLQLDRFISVERLHSFSDKVTTLKLNIKQIRKQILQNFATPIVAVLRNIIVRSKGIEITLESTCDDNVSGRIRPSEFAQIMENMLANAHRALLQNKKKQLSIACSANMDRLFIRLQDNGPGIPEDIRQRIFHEQITTKNGDGGFGLFHAHKVLAKYGGAIRLCEPQPQKGAAFEIEIKRIMDE